MSEDFHRHRAKVSWTASTPYRYRILTDYILELILRVAPISSKRIYERVAFVFRIVQNLAIFLLAYKYFRTLNITPSISILGILILSYSMCFVFYQSDLSFYTYTSLIFFLVSGILINLKCTNNNLLIPSLTILASLNREDAVFIPIMFFIGQFFVNDWKIPGLKDLRAPFLSFILFSAIYFGLRLLIGTTHYAGSRYGEVYPGIYLLWLNILNPMTWIGLVQAFGLLPFALLFFPSWPKLLKVYLLFLATPWFGVQFLFGSADETRLFLVPLALVFIPATMSLVSIGCDRSTPQK